MSPIGRIFLVLNLALAALFLGWASNALATSQDWKAMHDQAVQEKEDMIVAKEEEISSLQVDLTQETDQARRHREERDQLQSEVERLKTQLAEEKRRGEGLAGDVTKIQTTLGQYKDQLDQFAAARDRALEQVSELQGERDQAQAALQDAEQAMRDAQGAESEARAAIDDYEKRVRSLQEEVARLDANLQTIVEVTGVALSDVQAQPKIDGAVLNVRHDLEPGLVMINVGKNQGVKTGFTFDVFKGSQYKGAIRVQDVQENVSSALIKMAVPGTEISRGDRATTHL